MPPLLMHLVFSRLSLSPMPCVRSPAPAKGVQKSYLGPQIRQHVAFMEAALAESDWFAGNTFSAADIQMSFPLRKQAALSMRDNHGCWPGCWRSTPNRPTSARWHKAGRTACCAEHGGTG